MGLFSSRLSPGQMAPLCRQLATSYNAGIPILRGLELTAQHASSRKIKGMLGRMRNAIRNGATLHDAARAESELVPDFFVEVLGAGEVGGRLDEMLRDLADYYENLHAMRRSVLVSMVYPGLQLTAAWFLGTFALGLAGRFSLSETRNFNVGDYFTQYAVFQARAMIVFALLFAVVVALSRLGLFNHVIAPIKEYVWPIRPITRRFGLARFFRGMSLLVGAGLDMRQCIQRSAKLTMNPRMERDLMRAVPVVANGGTLVEAFSKCTTLSRIAREMIAVGEVSGDLDGSMRKVAEWHFEEARAAVRTALTVMGILVLLLVGGIIGYIVISFYSGYFNMLDTI